MDGAECGQDEQGEMEQTGHDLTVRPVGVLPGQERQTYVMWTFLNPIEIPAGEAFMMLAPDDFRAVERIPDWYWNVRERQVKLTYLGLAEGVKLMTYFTCRREPDGTMFQTMVVRPDSISKQGALMGRAKSFQEALEVHAYWEKWFAEGAST
jgi:hypothetical protein